ncbi:MAG: HD domain-containing protein [Bacteroidota bacterium]|nr:HD domain-containing protein [Candidatus Kapabacteria bacterium]MDW8220060.1 HD domain-containing protein [Bacteroidota bacterium]
MKQPYFHLEPSATPYNRTFLAKDELEARLRDAMDILDLHKVLSAYELAESVHESIIRNDGTPFFYHSTRVCKILIDELECFDADVLSAALLHDVLEDSKTLTKEVLEYNFGQYVAYIVETLTKDLEVQRQKPDEVDLAHVEKLKNASEDCLLIRLAARLDNFRCLEFNLKRNPILYINNTAERYIPLAEKRPANKRLQYLVRELKKERNKFLG